MADPRDEPEDDAVYAERLAKIRKANTRYSLSAYLLGRRNPSKKTASSA